MSEPLTENQIAPAPSTPNATLPLPVSSPFPIAGGNNPADPTNSVAGPYVPSQVQTGLPVSNQTPIDQRLNAIFNPALTMADMPKTQISDFVNRDLPQLPQGMSLKDALFSTDPKIKDLASQIVNSNSQKDQFTRAGGGDSINTSYDQASRYDNKTLGFNPLRNNESLYEQNQGFWPTLGNVAANLIGKTTSYALQSIGLVGGAPAALLPGGINNMTDNFITRAADWLKDKTEKDFPIYKSDKYTNGDIWQKLGTLGWWADDAIDRVALTAAMFLPGLAETKGFSLAGAIGEDGIATGAGAKALQAVAADPGGYGTVMKTFLPKLYKAAAEGTVDLGTSPALRSYVKTLSRAEMGAWNVLGQSGLNGKETYDAILKETGDKDKAADGAVKSFWETLPLSMTNTLIELPQMFSTVNTAKSLLSKVVDKESGLASSEVLEESISHVTPSIPKAIGKALLTGLEHGQNESMQVAVSRYNEDFAKNAKPGEHDSASRATLGIFGDFLDNIHDPNGQNNIALGTIQGILTSLAGRGIKSVRGEYSQEKTQLTNLYNNINQAQLQRRYSNGDFSERDDQGNIKVDANGKVINDQSKIAAAGLSLAGIQGNLQEKQDALKSGDYLAAAWADHRSLVGLSEAYFRDTAGIAHLSNLLRIEAKAAEQNTNRVNDTDSLGNPITPEIQLQNRLDMVKQLKKAYDAVQERHAPITDLGIDKNSKIESDQAKAFLNKLQFTQYAEAATQLFHIDQLEKNTQALGQLALTTESIDPDSQRITNPSNPLEEKHNALMDTDDRLKASFAISKTKYKLAIDKDAQRKAFQQELKANKHVIDNAAKKIAKIVTPVNTASQSTAAPITTTTPVQTVVLGSKQNTYEPAPSNTIDVIDLEKPDKTIPREERGDPDIIIEQSITKAKTIDEVKNDLNELGYKISDPDKFYQFVQDRIDGKTTQSFADWSKGTPTNAFVTKNPEGNITGTFQTEQEAKDKVVADNKALTSNTILGKATDVEPGPQSQEEIEKNNADNQQDIQQQLEEERVPGGKMINNSLSIATKVIQFDNTSGVVSKDENGRPRFNYNQNADIDFNKVPVGSIIYIKYDQEATESTQRPDHSSKPGSELHQSGVDTEANKDNVYIKVYTKPKEGNERLIGYLHTIQGAKRLLSESSDTEAELAKLSALRELIISSSDQEFQSKVTKTGFGFPNKGTKYTTVHEATEGDAKAIVAVKKGSSFIGEGGTAQPTRFGDGIKDGSTVLMLPNNVNGVDTLIPIYIAKKPVATDTAIKDIVSKSILQYLNSGDQKDLDPARNYVYITNSGLIATRLTNNGLFLNQQGELIYRGKPISTNMDDLLSQLLINVNQSQLNSPAYVKSIRNSPAIQTNFFARTRPGSTEKSYFHQHTIQFSDPINTQSTQKQSTPTKPADLIRQEAPAVPKTDKYARVKALTDKREAEIAPIAEALREAQHGSNPNREEARARLKEIGDIDEKYSGLISSILDEENETEQENLDRLNREMLQDLENDGFIVEDSIPIEDLSPETIANVASQPSTLLIPGFNAFIQNDAIDSVSHLLLASQFTEADISSTSEDNKSRVQKEIQDQLDKYNVQVEKYAPLIAAGNATAVRVSKFATNLKLVVDNFDAVYQLATDKLSKIGLSQDEQGYYEPVENGNDFLNFDDDSEYTRDNYDSISKLVKQFISFNPEKVTKDGKIGNKLNNLGLPQVVQAAAIYNKIINHVSEQYYEPTYEGFLNMADNLATHPDPTIQDIASRLSKSENAQLKFQFFTNMLKFKTDHVQQLITQNKEGIFARNIEANRSQITKVVFDQMQNEFNDLSQIQDKTQDQYGNDVYRVNPKEAANILLSFDAMARAKESYGYKRNQDGQPTGARFLKPEVLDNMYKTLQLAGFNFSKQAFSRAINQKSSTNPRGDARQGLDDLFLSKDRILQNMAKEDGNSQEKDLRNPFISNPTEMSFLAKVEGNYRNISQTGSFRSNGKSYYPFTRQSYLKNIFDQISQMAQTGNGSTLLQSFLRDPFQSASRFLKQAQVDAKFSPELWFARGVREQGSKGQNKEIKDTNDKEFIISKIHAFQNSGNKEALFYSDTYSDKTTRFQVKVNREPVTIAFVGPSENISIDEATLDKFYNYFQGELRRINQVRQQNIDTPNEQRISSYHDLNGKEGIGKYFVVFNYLNQNNLTQAAKEVLYNEDGSFKGLSPEVENAVKQLIQDNMVESIKTYKAKLTRYGVFTDPETGNESSKGLNDTQYYTKSGVLKYPEHQRAFVITADYVINSALNSLEMLTLTGDPAQSPKVQRNKSGNISVNQTIKATLTEVSKRNASLNAPFDQGIYPKTEYRVGFVQDLRINSDQLAYYQSLLPGQDNVKGYKTGDMTDAQEVTTVKEHLYRELEQGRISIQDVVEGLSHFDPEDFDDSRKELSAFLQQLGVSYTLNQEQLNKITAEKDMTGLLQVHKPVQRYARWDDALQMNVQTYIKTSSFPLVPALVEGKDFEEVLKQMKLNKIDRLNFSSGTKQGLINPQSIYTAEGEINPSIFTSNLITLPGAAWGEQVQNPEKDSNLVTEGSQQQRLIFVDLPDNSALTYKGSPITGKSLREQYVKDHKTIYDAKQKKLFDELGIVSANGVNTFSSLKSLSDIIAKEGLDRNYDRNTLLSIGLNNQGQFEIPLTFQPNSSQIQALIAAIVSNRILKNKLPGNSFIQGSEAVIKTNGKLKVSSDLTQAKGGIVWTKPEYANISKLQYIRKGTTTQNQAAQIVLPFFFKAKLAEYTNKDGFLDLSKIDSELLEINGFRIPYAGPNSGMWFDVVGFMPETMGSLVLVPAEVAAQMGADYDVDKLFTYVQNHTVSKGGIRLDNSTPQKEAENNIILAHKAIYLDPSRTAQTVDPTSTDELADAVERNLPKPSEKVSQIFDPEYQDQVWLSNRAGQLGVGISANFNTFHALAQQANLFTTGIGIKFLDSEGKVYNEESLFKRDKNTISGEGHGLETYLYGKDNEDTGVRDDSITRLDRIKTLPNPFTGETRTISSVINNWLQASVDNAKLQLLGAGGINKFNFNVALAIGLHGFDSDWIIPFINQPILKEYYEVIAGVDDKFNKDFTADKKDVDTQSLIDHILKKVGTEKFDIDYYDAVSHDQLISGVDTSLDKMSNDQLLTQLNVLKQFLKLEKIGRSISGISGDTKVEVRGLSKSFAEINQQAKDIEALPQSAIGNVHRIISDTVSGVYLDVPRMVDDLFNHPDNPIFAYSTPVYQEIGALAQGSTGRTRFGAEMLDNVYKDFKQNIYTHPSLGLYTDLTDTKNSLLTQTETNDSLGTQLAAMKQKYPNSLLLNQLSLQSKKRANDPDILLMQNAADDVATQIKQEWFDFFQAKDPALVSFVNKLTTYSLLFGNKEYGPSNMIKYIPFEVLKGIGFGEKLNQLNLMMTNNEHFVNFLRQYIQHNHELTRFVSAQYLPKNTQFQQGVDGKATRIPAQFTLGEPSHAYITKNPAYKAIAYLDSDDTYQYRRFMRTYVDDTIKHTLYELQADKRTYKRIDTLGNQYISEYDFTNPDARTIFPLQQSSVISTEASPSEPSQSSKEKLAQNPTPEDISTYYQSKDILGSLDSIQLRTMFSDTPINSLHYELAKALSQTAPNYKIEFNDKTGIALGHVYHDKDSIVIFPKEIERVASNYSIPFEEQLQRTILHEAVHTVADRFMIEQEKLPESQQDSRYKQVLNVWNQYRKALVINNKTQSVRGISDSFLEAELYKALSQRARNNRYLGYDHEVTLNSVFFKWDKVKSNREEILSVIHSMQLSMAKAYSEQGIGEKANFDLVEQKGSTFIPIDTERVAQIVDFLDKSFTKQKLLSLKEKYYAYMNPFEFNTMTLTSPGFQEHLASIPSNSNNNKSLWQSIKAIIAKIVSSVHNTLLSDAIDAVMNIASARPLSNTAESSPSPDAQHTATQVTPAMNLTKPEVVNNQADNRNISDKLTNKSQDLPTLNVSEANIARIKSGEKNMVSLQAPMNEGIYSLPDGTRVQATYEGEGIVVEGNMMIAGDVNDESTYKSMTLDEFAKTQGFKSWNTYVYQNPLLSDFTEGNELRYMYKVKTFPSEDMSIDQIIQSMKDNNTLEQNC